MFSIGDKHRILLTSVNGIIFGSISSKYSGSGSTAESGILKNITTPITTMPMIKKINK
jgi:hypothetical protein